MPLNPKTFLLTVTFALSALINQTPVLHSQVITIEPKENELLSLPFKPSSLSIDSEDEQKMLLLINVEREKAGLKALVWSEALADVAREHSRDMWQRQYFGHIDPDGNTPFDRLQDAEINFNRAGENLALARTLERAHDGLMNSDGHRRNILDPNFKKVGIGVIDGGIYGKMFTQDFTD